MLCSLAHALKTVHLGGPGCLSLGIFSQIELSLKHFHYPLLLLYCGPILFVALVIHIAPGVVHPQLS